MSKKKGLRQRESTEKKEKGEEERERQRLTSGLGGIRKPPLVLGPCPVEFLDSCITFWANLPLLSTSCYSLLSRSGLISVESVSSPSRRACPFSGPLLTCSRLRRTVLGGSSTWRPLLSLERPSRSETSDKASFAPYVLGSLRPASRPSLLPYVADRTPDWARVIRQRAEG